MLEIKRISPHTFCNLEMDVSALAEVESGHRLINDSWSLILVLNEVNNESYQSYVRGVAPTRA